MPTDRDLSTSQVKDKDVAAFLNRELIPFVRRLHQLIRTFAPDADLTALTARVLALEDSVVEIEGDITDIAGDIVTIEGDVSTLEGDLSDLSDEVDTKTTLAEANSLPTSTDSVNSSGTINITYALHYKSVLVVDNTGAQNIVLPSDASEPDIAVGDWGVVRRRSATNKPKFISDGTSVVAGTYHWIGRDQSEVRWRKTAANTYELGGNTSL